VITSYTVSKAFPDAARLLIICEIWISFAVVMMSAGAARALRGDIGREVEADILRSESSGLWNLLDLVCDVVVPLDDKLRIKDKAPRFAAMVMSQGRDIEGMRLDEFMPSEEDREAFERCATSVTPNFAQGTAPRALHVKLRDGLGNAIRVELFCVQVLTLVARSHYVGIREFSDYAPIPECRTFDKKTGRSKNRRSQRAVAETPKRGTPADASVSPLGRGERVDRVGAPNDAGCTSSSSGSSSDSEQSGPSISPSPFRGGMGLSQGSLRGKVRVQTSDVALQLALVRLMRMCSEPAGAGSGSSAHRSETSCCPFHSRVDLFSARLVDLRAMPCVRNFRRKSIAQCNMCGLFVDDDRTPLKCFACLSSVQRDSAQAQPRLTL